MNKKLKEALKGNLVFLLDGSGSMNHKREETIRDLNSYIKSLQDQDLDFTLIVWDDDRYTTIFSGDIKGCPPIAVEAYVCLGLTPLFDVVGVALASLLSKPGKKMLTILTDGQENVSKEYTLDKVKELVKDFQEAGNLILFMGEGMDTWQGGATIGIPMQYVSTYTYNIDSHIAYSGAACQTRSYFSNGDTDDTDPNTVSSTTTLGDKDIEDKCKSQ